MKTETARRRGTAARFKALTTARKTTSRERIAFDRIEQQMRKKLNTRVNTSS